MPSHRIAVILLIVLLPLTAWAKEMFKPSTGGKVPLDIIADNLEYLREKGLYVATGDVELIEGPRSLKARKVTYDEISGDVYAEGDVVYKDPDQTVYSETLSLNVITKEGVIEKGRIHLKQGNVFIRGDQIYKTGETTYLIQMGEFTTCGWDDPVPWKFTARDVDITVEGYAYTKDTRFKIWDHTALYLPWGMFPAKTQRQSGLLMPEFFLSSRDGIIFRDWYFWAIDKDKDATFGLQWIQDRGLKPEAELRYALTEDTKGTWYGSAIDDEAYKHWRWEVRGKHEQVLFKDLTIKTDVDFVSDINYLEDFGDNLQQRSQNSLRSTLFFEKPLTKSLLTGETTYFKTLQQQNNDIIFQYLPLFSYFTEFIPIFKERFYTDVVSEFTNFYRAEGEKWSRLIVEPRLHLPLYWQGVNMLATGAFRQRGYMANGGGDQSSGNTTWKSTVQLNLDANMRFWRDYQTDFLNLGTMRSSIVPRAQYTYIPPRSFRDVPGLDPSDKPQKTSAVIYGVGHYLNGLDGGVHELAFLELSQAYSLSDALLPSTEYDGSGNRFSDIRARLTLTPGLFTFGSQTVYNIYGKGLVTSTNGLTMSDPKLYHLTLSHTYGRDSVNEVFLDIGGKSRLFDALLHYRYSFVDSTWVDTTIAVTYHPNCWSLIFTFTQTRRPNDTRFGVAIELAGLGRR